MAYSTFPTIKGIGWPVQAKPIFNTLTQQASSGHEFRIGLMSTPLYEYTITFNYLTQADYTTLLNFFVAQLGSLTPFYFTPNNGGTVLVRFKNDDTQFDQFADQLYSNKQIVLRSVK
jgi:hypothetical protein